MHNNVPPESHIKEQQQHIDVSLQHECSVISRRRLLLRHSTHLIMRQQNRLLKVHPRDDLTARWRRQRTGVREIVHQIVGQQVGQQRRIGELVRIARLRDVGHQIDQLLVVGVRMVGHLRRRQIIRTLNHQYFDGYADSYLVEEGQHAQSIRMVEGGARVAVDLLVEHHVQLQREADAVDHVLAALRIVLAPMEVQLRKLVHTVQRTPGDGRRVLRVHCVHDCPRDAAE